MFVNSADLYDAIYAAKDYAGEAGQLHALITQHTRSSGTALLDVACGTGAHLAYLRQWYTPEGLDLDATILAVARQRQPDLLFHEADLVDFQLGRQYDAVVCLFSSIGYVKSVARLQQAIQTMQRHVQPGGVLIVEPWFTPTSYQAGTTHARFVDQPALKIARMNVSQIEGRVSVLDFHYLVATPAGVEHFTERHELGLFTAAEYQTAFHAAGLDVVYGAAGLMGRGLYIGVRPLIEDC